MSPVTRSRWRRAWDASALFVSAQNVMRPQAVWFYILCAVVIVNAFGRLIFAPHSPAEVSP